MDTYAKNVIGIPALLSNTREIETLGRHGIVFMNWQKMHTQATFDRDGINAYGR